MRFHNTTGDNSRVAKLTADQAREIYIAYKVGKIAAKDIAEEYGVTLGTVYKIGRGEAWSDATPELRKIHGGKK